MEIGRMKAPRELAHRIHDLSSKRGRAIRSVSGIS
jgi:hypothetical protein